uniref:Uncharacterized protein n=1 Tax=Panagrolaimus sp. JU765 TaxID=591449 RepID=A0AC34QRZ4_9BILA
MGLKDSLIEMMGDFVQINRNPEFRSKTELSSAGPSDGKPVQHLHHRRHSLNITVGTQGPPETVVRTRTYSVSSKKDDRNSVHESPNLPEKNMNRRFSAPSVLRTPPAAFAYEKDEKHKKKKLKPKQQPSLKAEAEYSSDSDDSKRKLTPEKSPRFNSSGFFRPGSFRESAPIVEEPEEAITQGCNNNGITIITRF